MFNKLSNLTFRSVGLVVLGTVTVLGPRSLAQNHHGQVYGSAFGSGLHGVGGFQTSGQATFGGPGLMQRFGGGNSNSVGFNSRYPIGNRSLGGGSPNFSYGTIGTPYFGVDRGGYGALNYPSVYQSPVIWSTPSFNYSPSVFGYGTGVFSPNFPSGNYVSNGYVGFVPNGAYGSNHQWGGPLFNGANPNLPGNVIAPTMLNLNMNVNAQQAPSSSASYLIVDPRLIDQVAPAPGEINPAQVPNVQEFAPGHQPHNEQHAPVIQDGAPVLNEFGSEPRDKSTSTLSDKIQSLRYQASGDDAFRKEDYATADVFYATALKTAPDRRAPYFRMAFVRIALNDFPQAVRFLKTGLAMESDASRPWITAEELYESRVAERARSHSGPLWNWLSERPLSADRLLLAGTFQKLRGFDQTADQMLDMAYHEGPEAFLVEQVLQLVKNDTGPRAISEDLDRMIDNESNQSKESDAAPQSPTDSSTGIFLKGKDVAAGNSETKRFPPFRPSTVVVPPSPETDPETQPVEFQIPLPE